MYAVSLQITSPKGQVNVNRRNSLIGRQSTMRRRSVVARLARKVLVGDLKELFLMTVRMMRMLPDTPRAKVKL